MTDEPIKKRKTVKAVSPVVTVTVPELGDLERVLLQGDLSHLTEPQRIDYYRKICTSVGLNPLTKPFEYLKLNGKMVLYATRNCTDQLCDMRQISTTIVSADEQNDLFIVRARVSTPTGRQNESIGAVSIRGLSGEYRANAMMKAETKAKRRAVLSLCGLSFMDEVEAEDVPRYAEAGKDGAKAVAALESKHIQAQSPAPLETKTPPPVEDAVMIEEDYTEDPSFDEPDEPNETEEPETKTETPATGSEANAVTPIPSHLPQATEVVHKMLADGRYVPWMTWIEQEGFWDPFQGDDIKTFAIRWNGAIKLARNYGGAHWKRVKAAFQKGGLTLKD